MRRRIIWSPFACRWCGEEQSHHGRSYIPSKGIHAWEQPTPAQIKARMKARRTARKQGAR